MLARELGLSGYASTAAFCAAFRRVFGNAPGALRQP
jgi:AraC-like DNA-binding protein